MTLAESKDSFEISSWGRLEVKGTAMCFQICSQEAACSPLIASLQYRGCLRD